MVPLEFAPDLANAETNWYNSKTFYNRYARSFADPGTNASGDVRRIVTAASRSAPATASVT